MHGTLFASLTASVEAEHGEDVAGSRDARAEEGADCWEFTVARA